MLAVASRQRVFEFVHYYVLGLGRIQIIFMMILQPDLQNENQSLCCKTLCGLVRLSSMTTTHSHSSADRTDIAERDRDLVSHLYDELRRVARTKLSQERVDHTLQPTALVHEVWIKLNANIESSQPWKSKGQFLAAAAEAMRRILIDSARRRSAQKRKRPVAIHFEGTQIPLAEMALDDLVDLNDAIDRLSDIDSESAELVKLRLYTGMTVEESAEMMGIAARSAYRIWAFAQAWLHNELHN